MPLVDPEPFEDALQTLERKLPFGSPFNTAQWATQAVAVRERAFFSATIESVRFLQRSRSFILDYLERETEETEGGIALTADGRARFIRDMARLAIQEGLGPVGIPADKVDPNDLTDIRSEARLGLIFDTQTRQAVGHGFWVQGMDPAILYEFPAAKFVRYPGSKDKRPRHARHEGEIRLKTDNQWWANYQNDPAIGGFGVPYPPYGFNSNMDQEDVSRSEAISLGLLPNEERDRQLAERHQIPSFNATLKASVRGLDPDLRRRLEEYLGTKTEGNEIRPVPRFQPNLPGLN